MRAQAASNCNDGLSKKQMDKCSKSVYKSATLANVTNQKQQQQKGARGVCSSKAKTSLIKINIFFYILFHNLSKQEHISHHRAKNEESKQPNLCMIFFFYGVLLLCIMYAKL